MGSASKSIFPSEPLDLRDRRIIEVACKYGRGGQSFNKLAEEVEPFASRSTFALRVERLQRLGYVEKLPDERQKQVKRIRCTLQTRMFMWTVARTINEINKIERLVSEKADELSKQPKEEALPDKIKAFKEFVDETFRKITQIFSTVTMSSITYGETAAGDIFLPSTVERLRSVMLKFASTMVKYPELSFPTERMPPEEKISEAKMFFEEFGEEILERLPERLQSRKEIIEEMIKHPEKQELIFSLFSKKGMEKK